MSVALRLSRGGSKKRPFYRIVAADVRSPRDGRYLERLGTYNPMRKKDDPERIVINKDRAKYWLSVGAKPTDRVTKFLFSIGLVKKPDLPKQTKQDKPRKKTLEKLKAKEEKMKTTEAAAQEKKDKPITEAKPVEAPSPEKTQETAEAKPVETPRPEKTQETAEAKPVEAPGPEKTQETAEAKPAETPNPEKTQETAEAKPTEAAVSEKPKETAEVKSIDGAKEEKSKEEK